MFACCCVYNHLGVARSALASGSRAILSIPVLLLNTEFHKHLLSKSWALRDFKAKHWAIAMLAFSIRNM